MYRDLGSYFAQIDDSIIGDEALENFFHFFVLKLKIIMKSFVAYTSVVMVCYRPHILGNSIGYLETALLMARSWYSLILPSCLISEVDPLNGELESLAIVNIFIFYSGPRG